LPLILLTKSHGEKEIYIKDENILRETLLIPDYNYYSEAGSAPEMMMRLRIRI